MAAYQAPPSPQDRRDGGQGLHVVDQGRGAPEARLGRERRPGPGRAALPLDRGQQRGFLAADVGTGPHPHLQPQLEALPAIRSPSSPWRGPARSASRNRSIASGYSARTYT